jgi:hypothetical protein
MDAMTIRDQDLTVKNVLRACEDITKLNSRGYKFLYLCSGFIAHYNIHGFMDHYSSSDLARDILSNASSNKYLNFREGDSNYNYYKSKADTYARIVKQLENKTLNIWNT